MIKFILHINLMLIFTSTNAQTPEWRFWNTSELGFWGDHVGEVGIDHNGNKWVSASVMGLGKFNGKDWVLGTFPDGERGIPLNTFTPANVLEFDDDDNIWVGTNYGLFICNGEFWTLHSTSLHTGIPNDYIQAIVVEKNKKTWVATGGGPATYDGTKWDLVYGLPSPRVNSIKVDSLDNIWVGMSPSGSNNTGVGGIGKYDGSNWTFYTNANSALPNKWVNSIVIGKNNVVWGNMTGFGIFQFNGVSWKTYTPANSGLPGTNVSPKLVDEKGNLWLASGQGLVKYDGKAFITYKPTEAGLPGDAVYSVAIDNGGNKWIGAIGGLAVFNESGIVTSIFNFEVKNQEGYSAIKWGANLEKNFLRFEIERSIDYAAWSSIRIIEDTDLSKRDFLYEDSLVDAGMRKIVKYRIKIINIDSTYFYSNVKSILTEFSDLKETEDLPSKFTLDQNYPNPFNPGTKIKYSIPVQTFVNLKVYDVLGRIVTTLLNEEKPAGNYEVEFNATALSNGIYFYRLQTDNYIETKKMILLK